MSEEAETRNSLAFSRFLYSSPGSYAAPILGWRIIPSAGAKHRLSLAGFHYHPRALGRPAGEGRKGDLVSTLYLREEGEGLARSSPSELVHQASRGGIWIGNEWRRHATVPIRAGFPGNGGGAPSPVQRLESHRCRPETRRPRRAPDRPAHRSLRIESATPTANCKFCRASEKRASCEYGTIPHFE